MQLKALLELAKVRITVAVAFTTMLGYILATSRLDSAIILPTLGLFFIACAAAVLNHIQEWHIDRQMPRTRKRPIPSGAVQIKVAVIFMLTLFCAGSILLAVHGGYIALFLGYLAMFWYNAVYTPLKRYSAWAVIPGSLIGAIPPLVGWVSGGGDWLDPQILVTSAYFFVWQIPHFWLLLLLYDKQYKAAGLPTLASKINQRQLKNMIFSWTAATGFFAVAVPLFAGLQYAFAHILLLLAALALMLTATVLLRQSGSEKTYRQQFLYINLFTLFFIFVMAIDRLWS
jgi:protoheme IX farnesyltransferase